MAPGEPPSGIDVDHFTIWSRSTLPQIEEHSSSSLDDGFQTEPLCRTTPVRRSDPHVVLEGPLEGGLGLISDGLRNCPDRH
jgi:hypothetical protein